MASSEESVFLSNLLNFEYTSQAWICAYLACDQENKSTLWPETPSVCLTELGVPAGVIYLIPMLTECFRDLLFTCKILTVGFWAIYLTADALIQVNLMLPSVSQNSEDGKWIANSRWALFEELWEHCNAPSVCNTLLSYISTKVSLLLKESQSIANSVLL